MQGDITVGVLVGFLAALNGFFDPIGQLSQVYTTYQSGMAALDKIFELLDEQPELTDSPDARELPHIRGEIAFDHVSFAYRTDDGTKLALDDVDLTIPPGQTVALVGRHGRRQVDVRQARRALLRPHVGAGARRRARPARRDRALAARPARHRAPGGVPLQRDDRREHRVRAPGARPEDLEAAARAVGAWEFVARLPAGLDTEVGERGVQLSAGQRQLVAFARALVADPRILVLDEATSNVDLHTEGRIEDGLRRLLAGRTAIVIAHRLSTIRQAGRIVVLDGGRVAEQGTHDELLEAGGAYAALYQDWAAQAAA